jgi:Uma2 family endonuclease
MSAEATEPWPDLPYEWTETDIADMPDNGCRYEVIDGELIVTPPASWPHQRISVGLLEQFQAALPEGWWCGYRVGLRVAEQRLISDLVVLRGSPPNTEDIYTEADVALVVEIESRSTKFRDQRDKLVAYATAGIPVYLRVERGPHGPVVHVHSQPANGVYHQTLTVLTDERLELTEPFPFTVAPATIVPGLVS